MQNKKELLVLFIVMFLVMVGFGIIIPVLPFYAEDLGASPTQLGLLMAVYSVMQLIFSPIWGRISDRIGRKPVMILGITGLAISFFMMAYASKLWMLFAARIIGGLLSSANMPTVMAYVADITTEEDRGKGMGLIGASVGLGFILGPAIGGIFSKNNLSTPFFIAGISSFITIFLILFILKETLTEKKEIQEEQKFSLKQLIVQPLAILYFLQLFVSMSLSGLEATFAYFAAQKAGLTSVDIGYIFMIMGIAGAVVQGGLVGPLTKKFGEGFVIQIGTMISAIGFGLILFIDSFLKAAIFLTIFGLGNGVIRPCLSALLTKKSTIGHGSTTGMLSSFDSLGRIMGPPLAGWLFSKTIGLPYISGIVLSIAAFLLFFIYKIKTDKHEQTSTQ